MSACRAFSRSEVPLLLGACQGRNGLRDRTYILLGICTGFRVSELLQLQRKDVVDYRGLVLGRLTVSRRSMKKKREGRTVPISDSLKVALETWLTVLQVDGYCLLGDHVFPSCRSRRAIGRSSVWKMLRRRAMAAKLDVSLVGTHTLRKTFAAITQEHFKSSGDLEHLRKTQAALGHAEIGSTMKYLKSISDEEKEAGFAAVSRMVFAGDVI